jgi:hypothetical protein
MKTPKPWELAGFLPQHLVWVPCRHFPDVPVASIYRFRFMENARGKASLGLSSRPA